MHIFVIGVFVCLLHSHVKNGSCFTDPLRCRCSRFIFLQYPVSGLTTIGCRNPVAFCRTSGKTGRGPPGACGTWTRPDPSRCSWPTGRAPRPSSCPPTGWTRTKGTWWRSRSKAPATCRPTNTEPGPSRRTGTTTTGRTTATRPRWRTPTLRAFETAQPCSDWRANSRCTRWISFGGRILLTRCFGFSFCRG